MPYILFYTNSDDRLLLSPPDLELALPLLLLSLRDKLIPSPSSNCQLFHIYIDSKASKDGKSSKDKKKKKNNVYSNISLFKVYTGRINVLFLFFGSKMSSFVKFFPMLFFFMKTIIILQLTQFPVM